MNAALGGLRVFKGITCDGCNKAFSRTLDKTIALDLAPLNALAAVVSRHRGTATWTKCTDDGTGYEYLLSAGRKLRQLKPIELPEGPPVNGMRRRTAIFSDEEQLREWLAAVEAEGKPYSIVEKWTEPVYFPRPLRLDAGFGGLESLRAVARIAMNYLARYFGAIAREPALQPFRDFVLGKVDEPPLRFDYGWNCDLPPMTYTFGHRVVVGVRETGEVIGGVGFFGVFEFSVSFGSVRPGDSAMQIVDVDPVAEDFPDDMREFPLRPCSVAIADKAPPMDTMEIEASRRVTEMKRRAGDRNWNDDAPELLRRVREALCSDECERESKLSEVLETQNARILNLATAVCASIASQAARAPGVPVGLVDFLQTLFDTDQRNQLRSAGFTMLVMIRDRIVEHILDEGEEMTEACLRLYLEGNHGHRAAFASFLEALEDAAGLLEGNAREEEPLDCAPSPAG